jgi:hypothetical protein
MINIEEITAISWRRAYGLPLSCCGAPVRNERHNVIEFAALIAKGVVEQCIREIGAVPIVAPDADIVKEKITSRLRIVASEIPS